MSVNRDAARRLAHTFLWAVTLNFAWEMAQAPFCESMGTVWQATRRCFVASLGDGVLILLVVALEGRCAEQAEGSWS